MEKLENYLVGYSITKNQYNNNISILCNSLNVCIDITCSVAWDDFYVMVSKKNDAIYEFNVVSIDSLIKELKDIL